MEFEILIENPEKLDKENIREDMYNFVAKILFERHRGEENVPNDSVIVGNIYDSKCSNSCQIRYTKNGVIVRCKYIKETGLFEFEFYELTHVDHCYRVKTPEEEMWYKLFAEYKDYIDEVRQENKKCCEKQIKKKEKTQGKKWLKENHGEVINIE